MASDPRFSRLFDEWDHDEDISMISLNTHDTAGLSAVSSPSPTHSRTGSEITKRPSLPAYDDLSTRSLLQKRISFATTTDYESVKNGSIGGEGEPRQRNGMGAVIQRLWQRRATTITFDGSWARGKPGLWTKQMLVDRSLRSMSAFTAISAVVMWIIIFSYLSPFAHRLNPNSTSVGREQGESCGGAEGRNVAVHLFINIAATMILGCSNTYQQLITALKVDEIRWVLSQHGDSKVGTNSPWSINHKKTGKTSSWLAWILLISTSLPVHFLANSVIGPSFYVKMPTEIVYTPMASEVAERSYWTDRAWDDKACWTAFRANSYELPDLKYLSTQYNYDVLGNSTTYNSVEVQYTSNCTAYLNNANVTTALQDVVMSGYGNGISNISVGGNCVMGSDVICNLGEKQDKQCRMNVRMQAAFILGGCLIIKAAYMIILNIRARHQVKNRCLTYGDVIVASVLDPELKIKNECMLNSGDGYRHKVAHTCHKHCRTKTLSERGDSVGHCQLCKKHNIIDKAADLPHPSIAIKYKRSLLSNLGSTAISQMIILTFTSAAMVAVSIMLIVLMAYSSHDFHISCARPGTTHFSNGFECSAGATKYLQATYGSWGGFSSSASLAALPSDSLGSEFLAFVISNGAQFLYSLLYLLLIYNLTLISMEQEWGTWETMRRKPRCTIVSGKAFEQSYFLQLPSKVLLPMMVFAASMHWLLGQAISTVETIYTDPAHGVEHSIYFVTYAAYPIFLSTILMVAMTTVCWWAFTYTREGFIPQMYGSIRACCASTTELTDFGQRGILWGDLGIGEKFRHAGFSSDEPSEIVPAELYCGRD